MKLYLTPLALACTLAHADITTTGTQGPWNLYAGAGTGKVLFQFPSWQQCKDAPKNPVLKLKGTDFMCKSQGPVKVVITPPPPPPPPPPAPPPPAPPPPAPPPAPAPAPAPASNLPFVDVSKIPAPAVGSSGPRITTDPAIIGGLARPNPSDIGAFRLGCFYSHMSFNDPLVFPGQPGKSHLHDFVGNTGVDANSTAVSIATSGNSTCAGGTLDRSAMWFPALIDTTDGTPIANDGFLVYYKTGFGGVKPADVRAVPAGLAMLAGSAAGTPDAPSGMRFACVGPGTGVGWQASIPGKGCQVGQSLLMEISFPQCWSGQQLDSPDHRSHLHEATGSGCPATHPVALPAISYEVYWSITAANVGRMPKWRLSSDNYDPTKPGGFSAHGDYIGGWDPATMAKIIANCDNPSVDCHANFVSQTEILY